MERKRSFSNQLRSVIGLCRALADAIMSKLFQRRAIFIARFGKDFVSLNDHEMRDRILSLSEDALSFLDTMHEAELGDCSSRFGRPLTSHFRGPFFIYKSPSTHAYVHQLPLYPKQVVTFVDESFEAAFGWQMSTFVSLQIEMHHILRSEDVVGLQCSILQSCVHAPSVETVPTFTQFLDILCANAQFRKCRVTHYTIRSSDLTPVYGILIADPLDG
jgi:hypothetical protein